MPFFSNAYYWSVPVGAMGRLAYFDGFTPLPCMRSTLSLPRLAAWSPSSAAGIIALVEELLANFLVEELSGVCVILGKLPLRAELPPRLGVGNFAIFKAWSELSISSCKRKKQNLVFKAKRKKAISLFIRVGKSVIFSFFGIWTQEMQWDIGLVYSYRWKEKRPEKHLKLVLVVQNQTGCWLIVLNWNFFRSRMSQESSYLEFVAEVTQIFLSHWLLVFLLLVFLDRLLSCLLEHAVLSCVDFVLKLNCLLLHETFKFLHNFHVLATQF